MAKIKSGLNDKPVDEVVQTSKDRNKKLKDPAVKVTVDSNLLTTQETSIGELEGAESGVSTAKNNLKQAVEKRDAAKSKLLSADTAIVNYINSQTSDVNVLLTTSYPLAEERSASPLEQVTNLSAAFGDEAGEIDTNFDRVKSATGYEFQISMDSPDNWITAGASGRVSKYTFSNLTAGKKYWMRVRAFRGEEKGAWSNPVSTTAPF